MNFKQIYCSMIFVIILLLSCTNTIDPIAEMLTKAEKCMEAHPDSALLILQEIPDPHLLQGKHQADYGILMTQALDKNYKSLDSDSLIQLSLKYYENSEDKISKGKAYFYYGRYLYQAKRHEEAMSAFLESKKFYEGSNHYKMLGLLSGYIGNINVEKDWYDEALSNHKESLKYYSLVNDSLSMTFAMRNIGRTYLLKGKLDSVYSYYSNALEIAENKNLISFSSILQEIGRLSRLTKDYQTSENFLIKSVENLTFGDIYTRYLSLGELNLEISQYDKAEKYLLLCLESPKITTQSSAYLSLSNLHKKNGNYKLAYEYMVKLDSINSVIDKNESKAAIADLQEKYKNEQIKNEYLQVKNHRNLIVLWGIIAFLVLIIAAIYLFYHNRLNKRKIKEIGHNILMNEVEIERYKKELLEFNDSTMEHLNEVGQLNGKISLLTHQNRDLTERLMVLGNEKTLSDNSEKELLIIAFRTLLSIKSGDLNRKLSDNDIALQIQLFNFLYRGFADRLMLEFEGITKHEIELCCLIKLGMTNYELSHAFNNALESVRKSKLRLKNRLNVSNDERLETFLLNY